MSDHRSKHAMVNSPAASTQVAIVTERLLIYFLDWMMSFKLRDLSVDCNPDVGEGVLTRVFRPREDMLPKVQKLGDVVLLRRPMVSYLSFILAQLNADILV
jgi:hypothetical protein